LAKIENYLDLIRRRANGTVQFSLVALSYVLLSWSGSLQTPATWIRNFVRSHPDYKYDSVVSQEINYDLLVAVDEM
jgi:glutamate--cysteine ligase catalytic subunit